jgi:hypothetical protein
MSRRRKVLIATRNRGKLREYEKLLAGLPMEFTYLDDEGIIEDVEETGSSFAENAVQKARQYALVSGLPALRRTRRYRRGSVSSAAGQDERRTERRARCPLSLRHRAG